MMVRNKGAFITGTLVACSLLIGLALSTTLYFRLKLEKAQRTVEAAQFAIMSGEDKWIANAVHECEAAGVPQSFVGVLIAEQHLIQGRIHEATTVLESLVQSSPKSIPARALLAIAHDLADEPKSYQRVMETLMDAKPVEREDFLMLGHALSHSLRVEDQRKGVALMEQAISRRDSPMARVMLAEARTRLAVESRSLEEIEAAVADINKAKGWLRGGVAVLAVSTWTHAVAAQIGMEKQKPELRGSYLAVAQSDGEQLDSYRPNSYAEKYRKLQQDIFKQMGATGVR